MMTHTKTLLTAFAASAMLAASSAQAAVIAEYTFSSSDGTSTDTETNSTATDFAGGTFEQIVTSGAITRASETTDSVAGAINEDDFYSFTVTPNATPAPGFEMNLTSLTFDGQHNAVTGDPVITNESISLFWRSSVDGFASNIGSTFTFAWNKMMMVCRLISREASFRVSPQRPRSGSMLSIADLIM